VEFRELAGDIAPRARPTRRDLAGRNDHRRQPARAACGPACTSSSVARSLLT
jgi:hypothetical protein